MDQEIKTNNILIAEFMGAHHRHSKKYGDLYRLPGKSGEYGENGLPLRYHNSWNWLMPVVEKIETLQDDHHGRFCVDISSNSCTIQGTNLYRCLNGEEPWNKGVYFINLVEGNKIKATYLACVSFIKWYNRQKLN